MKSAVRRSFVVAVRLLLLALAPACPAAQESGPPATLADLQQRLDGLIAQRKYAAALWGVKIVSLDTAKTLFEHNPAKLFSPASNSKLYTVALGLDRLGAEYRIRTSLYAKEKPRRNGTLKGDLIIYGRGDPCINARLNSGDLYRALEPLAAALTNAGVKKITGSLVADTTFFRGPEFGSGWTWDDLEYYYGAEISALTFNDNTVQVRIAPGGGAGAPCKLTLLPATTGLTISNRTVTARNEARRSISLYRPLDENVVYVSGQMPLDAPAYTEDATVHDPAGLFLLFFKEALRRHGIKVSGNLRTVHWLPGSADGLDPAGLVELGFMESPPMRDLAGEIHKPSQNLYTDLLLAHVGEKTRRLTARPDETSEDLGIRELGEFLAQAGVREGDVVFEEGSGLSRNNLATPEATVTLLQYMNRHKCADAYLQSLPIAGVDGTLRNRMKNTPAAGNVRAKTGTLRWASSLSGYVTTAAGERLAFSLMLNRYQNPAPAAGSARGDLDAIAILLAEFKGRSGE